MYIEYITQIRHYSRKYRPRLHQIYLLLFSTAVSYESASDLGNVDSAKTRKKPPSIGDKGQTDRVTMATRAGLRRCRWRRPRHAVRCCHNGDLLLRPPMNTQVATVSNR